MSLVAHQERGFSLFHLFGVVFGTFQPFLASHGLFRAVASNDITEYFDTQIYYKSIYFGNLLLFSPLGILEKLKFCYNQKKEELTAPTTDVSV